MGDEARLPAPGTFFVRVSYQIHRQRVATTEVTAPNADAALEMARCLAEDGDLSFDDVVTDDDGPTFFEVTDAAGKITTGH